VCCIFDASVAWGLAKQSGVSARRRHSPAACPPGARPPAVHRQISPAVRVPGPDRPHGALRPHVPLEPHGAPWNNRLGPMEHSMIPAIACPSLCSTYARRWNITPREMQHNLTRAHAALILQRADISKSLCKYVFPFFSLSKPI